MINLPPISREELEAELSAAAPPPDLPPDGVVVNGRTFRPILERQDDGVIGQTKHSGSRGTVVYKVRLAGQNTDPRVFALKVVRKDRADALGWREAFLSAQLSHERVVRFEDLEETDDSWLIVTEWCEQSRSLYEFCMSKGYGRAKRLRLFTQVFDAVAYLHDRHIVHRDLHLGNILGVLRTEAGRDVPSVKLIDFNNAVRLNAMPTDGGMDSAVSRRVPSGRASPGQRDGVVSVAHDIHTLGVSLCELLTGVLPTTDSSRPAGLDRELWAIIRKATAVDDANKYPTVAAFRRDLIRYQRGVALKGVHQSLWTLGKKYMSRHAVPMVVVLLVAVLAAFGWIQRGAAIRAEARATEQAENADRERQAAVRERFEADQARQAAIQAEQLAIQERDRATQLVTNHRASIDTFAKSDWLRPVASANADPQHKEAIREFLKRLSKAYESHDLADDADYQLWRGRGHYMLAETYEHLGESDNAAVEYDLAVQIHTLHAQEGGGWTKPHRTALVAALRRYGGLLRNWNLLDKADKLTRQAVVEAQKLPDDFGAATIENKRLIALTLNTRALVLSDLSLAHDRSEAQRDEAEKTYKEALALWMVFPKPSNNFDVEDRLQIARVRGLYGQHLLKWNRPADAEEQFRRGQDALNDVPTALAADNRKKEKAHAQLLHGLGQARIATGHPQDARTLLTKAKSLRQRHSVAQPNSPGVCEDFAATCLELARLDATAKDYPKARQEIEAALKLLEPFLKSPSVKTKRLATDLKSLLEKLPM